MSNIKTQQRIIEGMESVKYTTGALRDISAVELKKLREQFKKNDLFYSDLQDLYQVVWKIARALNGLSFLEQKNKQSTLYVAYTTNRHFYGVLNHDVMRKFNEATTADSDCLIIGNTGKEIWENNKQEGTSVNFLSFDGDSPSKEEVRTFLKKSADFESVVVFYPQFVSVYEQQAGSIDVTFRPKQTENSDAAVPEDIPQYFLEPDIEQMISFFNSQVRYMLFERMLLESELSRVAARLVRMDMAEHNASDMLKVGYAELRRAQRSFSSSRMLETMVGYLQWHKTIL